MFGIDIIVILTLVKDQLLDNQLFVGLTASGFILGISFIFKSVPHYIFLGLLRKFSVVLEMDNTCKMYGPATTFIFTKLQKTHILRHENKSLGCEGRFLYKKDDHDLTPGYGGFLFFYKGHPVIFHKSAQTDSVRHDILITLNLRFFFAFSNSIVKEFLEETEMLMKEKEDKIVIKLWNPVADYWQDGIKKRKRSLNTVFMNKEQKSRITKDVSIFLKSEEWYNEKGIPYKRGYLFHGPPGTGKSSLVLALASEHNLPIYYVNLPSIISDQSLTTAFNTIDDTGCIIVIEDIDLFVDSGDVKTKYEANNQRPQKPQSFLSIGSLLNVIDGLISSENKIIIFTSNNKDMIRDTLLRPGRIDVQEFIGPLKKDEIERMCTNFYGEFPVNIINPDIEMTGAELQELLTIHKEDKGKLINKLM